MLKAEMGSVLVIDDEDCLAEETCAGLELRGFRAAAAGGISQAREILRARPDIGVAFVDYHMPDMDGVEVIQALAAEFPRQLAFVMLTGDETQSVAIDAIRAQVFDFLKKPASGKEISETARRAHMHVLALSRSRQRQDSLESEIGSLRGRTESLSTRLSHRERLLRQSLRGGGAVTEFMTEEIRAPLRALLDHCKRLGEELQETGAAKDGKAIEILVESGRKLAMAVETVLSYEPPAGAHPLERTMIDFFNLAQSIFPAAEQFSESKHIKIKSRIPRNLMVNVNERMLARVVSDMCLGIVGMLSAKDHLTVIAMKTEQDFVLTFRTSITLGVAAHRVLEDDLVDILSSFDGIDSALMRLLTSRLEVLMHGGSIQLDYAGTGEQAVRVILPLTDRDVKQTKAPSERSVALN